MVAARLSRIVVASGCALALSACATTRPKEDQTAEITLAPIVPVASSGRGDRPPPARRDEGVLVASPTISDEDRERDARIRSLPRSLLVAEAAQLQSLLDQTSRGAPDYGLVLIRTAHAYGSVEAAAWQEGDTQVATTARRAALDLYERFLKELPSHPRVPEALYYAGLSLERAGDVDRARKSFFRVVSEHPGHDLVPACHYAFGVLFRRDAQADPSKQTFARQAFAEVVKYPDKPLARRAQAYLDESVPARPR